MHHGRRGAGPVGPARTAGPAQPSPRDPPQWTDPSGRQPAMNATSDARQHTVFRGPHSCSRRVHPGRDGHCPRCRQSCRERCAMHVVPGLKVLYFGTPVVLISSRNEDGSTNIAPMSSAWWLGQSCLLGLGTGGQTSANLRREGECVLNLPSSALAAAVDRIALTTGNTEIPDRKLAQGYRHVKDKFALGGLTRQASELVAPDRIAECPIQMECRLAASYPMDTSNVHCTAFQVDVLRSHVAQELVIPGTH